MEENRTFGQWLMHYTKGLLNHLNNANVAET